MLCFIHCTLAAIFTEVNDVQFLNASSLISSPLVIITVLRLLFLINPIATAGIVAFSMKQPLKAFFPMLVILSGIVTDINELQLRNAHLP